MPKIAAGATNKNISLAPNGTGKVVVGTGAADATVQSDGDHNLILQTGNSTTSKIEINDGANGDVAITPNGTGNLTIDNIAISDNTIISTDTNGNIAITPNGTGEVDISKVDIDGGAVDGVTLGTNSAVTEAQIDNINVDGNAITSTDTNGNIDLTPAGTGEVNISKVDIDGGAIDGTDVTVGSGKTLDVSAGSLTTSTAQKQAIIDGASIPTELPAQSGKADQLLTTNATSASWTPTHKMVASTSGITRSDGTVILSEDGSNVATLDNVTLGSTSFKVENLNGYEEGTWTPIIGGTGGTSGQTYAAANNGRYVKIGALVLIEFNVQLAAVLGAKGTITGNAMVGGFPFNTASTFAGAGTIGFWEEMLLNQHWCGIYMANDSDFAYLTYETTAATAGTTSASLMTTANISNSTRLAGSISYRTDE